MLLNEIIVDENNMAFIPSLGISYQLNESAKEIINLIKQGNSKDEIIKIISENSGAKWSQVYIDVDDFYKKLTVYGLLQ
jgi:fatty acid-binding protein DegV